MTAANEYISFMWFIFKMILAIGLNAILAVVTVLLLIKITDKIKAKYEAYQDRKHALRQWKERKM